MSARHVKVVFRGVMWAAGLVLAVGLPAVPAHADETHRDAHNGSSFALIRTGQIDDPMEDVLEHTLLLGGDHSWD